MLMTTETAAHVLPHLTDQEIINLILAKTCFLAAEHLG
jgi:hypothetical protein